MPVEANAYDIPSLYIDVLRLPRYYALLNIDIAISSSKKEKCVGAMTVHAYQIVTQKYKCKA